MCRTFEMTHICKILGLHSSEGSYSGHLAHDNVQYTTKCNLIWFAEYRNRRTW